MSSQGANQMIESIIQQSNELSKLLHKLVSKDVEFPPPAFASLNQAITKFHEYRLWFKDGVEMKRFLEAENKKEGGMIVNPFTGEPMNGN